MNQKYKPDWDARAGIEALPDENLEPFYREKHAFNVRQLEKIFTGLISGVQSFTVSKFVIPIGFENL
jgi:hypothetical protein